MVGTILIQQQVRNVLGHRICQSSNIDRGEDKMLYRHVYVHQYGLHFPRYTQPVTNAQAPNPFPNYSVRSLNTRYEV